MDKKGLMLMEFVSKDEKRIYVKPMCEAPESLLNNVSGSMDNKNVGEDPNDPWYTEED